MRKYKEIYIPGLLGVLFLCVLASGILLPSAARGSDAGEDRFAITLMSADRPIDVSNIARLEAFNVYTLYITTHKKKDKVWYRLRLGFFPDKGSAEKVGKFLKGVFPDAWSSRVSLDERALAPGLKVKWPKKSVKKPKRKRAPKAVTIEKEKKALAPDEERAKLLMDKAEEAMGAGKPVRAIEIYKEVLGIKDHKYQKSAQEFLGLARERKGDLRKARAEYMAYIILYPEGKDTERVRQRLAALETARAKPKKRLKKAKDKKKTRTRVYGSFSQFYHRDDSYTDLGGNVVNRSSLSNDMDLTVRRTTEKFQYTSVIILGYEHDFLNAGEDSKTYLSRAYFDLLDRKRRVSLRLGRQSRSSGGVLGRFDGAFLSYQMAGQVRLNLVGGYPVDSAVFEKFKAHKIFYGLSVDLGTFADHWDFNLFAIKQEAHEIKDREAVGMEARYFHTDGSLFALVDYDTSYQELNTFLVTVNFKISPVTRINTMADLRMSPILTTSNALQGQTASTLNTLLQTYNEVQIRSLALDRTPKSRTLLFGITRELSKKLQLSGDVTITELTGTPASGGVLATEGTGYDYFLSTQLVGSGLIKTGDTAIIGLRFSDTSSAKRLTFDVNTRYPVTRKWRVNPRVRVDYSWQVNNSANILKVRPSLRSDYYLKRKLKIEFDGGVELGYQIASMQNNNTRNYFFTLGYRKTF
jgi:hypothetical protein